MHLPYINFGQIKVSVESSRYVFRRKIRLWISFVIVLLLKINGGCCRQCMNSFVRSINRKCYNKIVNQGCQLIYITSRRVVLLTIYLLEICSLGSFAGRSWINPSSIAPWTESKNQSNNFDSWFLKWSFSFIGILIRRELSLRITYFGLLLHGFLSTKEEGLVLFEFVSL